MSLVVSPPAHGVADHRVGAGRVHAPVVTLAAAVLVVGLIAAVVLVDRARNVRVDLYSATVGIGPDGDRRLVPAAHAVDWFPGTRVLRPAAGDPARPRAEALARAQTAWLAAGAVPGAGGRFEDLARTALLDLNTLTAQPGGTVAAWTPHWRYIWPRDASFVVAALARTGRRADAAATLRFLQGVQAADGSFHARYRLDGAPPDARGVQEDGPGWALWAVAELLESEPDAARRRTLRAELGPLVDRSAARLLARTREGTRLPPPSSDYWEVPEERLTLGIAAVTLAGLEAAARIDRLTGSTGPGAGRAEAAAARTRSLVEDGFGADGYPRYRGDRDVDAAVTLLMPPFQPAPLAGAAAVLRSAHGRMARPAGGIAPGEGWKDDGISWTPETALLALAAAAGGDVDGAARHLGWLAAHRTDQGSLPEKVLSDGTPAAVAPLAWTAALVLLALTELPTGSGA